MKPVCVKCRVEMKCEKNGQTVIHEEDPNCYVSGDRWACPMCQAEVVLGFGRKGAIKSDVSAWKVVPITIRTLNSATKEQL